ncbi:MAG: queuosine precursor transporter [Bacteroidales bacterium]|jgi:uncharacterized integral membrane protein (TIGR00697 family)|nr:queuosine precursor transporter [Bacteroidales bacterium]
MKKQLFFICGILFTACMLIANVISSKIFVIGGWSAPAGVLVFPLAYVLNDVIVEVWDYRHARLIIWTGFGINAMAALFYAAAIALPPAPFYHEQAAFAATLGSSARLVIASLIAWLAGSFVNARIMNRFKQQQRGQFPLRAVVSTVAGEFIDSLLFISAAFVGSIPLRAVAAMIVTQASLKILYEIIILPVTVIVVGRLKKIKESEN